MNMLRACILIQLSFLLVAADGPRTGRFDDALRDPATGELIIHYGATVPANIPTRKSLGLLVLFHGSGGKPAWMIDTGHLRRYQALGLADGYVIIGGKSKGKAWGEVDDVAVTKLIDWAMDTYPIDPRRVHVAGYSAGADMSVRYGRTHSDRVASVAAIAGGSARIQKENPDTAQECYLFCGGADGQVVRVRKLATALRSAQIPCVYREYAGRGHDVGNDGWWLPDMALWRDRQRHKTIAPSVDELDFLRKLLNDIDRVSSQGICDEVVRIGGPAVVPIVVAAAKSERSSSRVAAASIVRRVVTGKAAVDRVVKLIVDEDRQVAVAAAEAMVELAGFSYGAGEQALIAMTRHPGMDMSMRLGAIGGLARSVQLPLWGEFSDRETFELLLESFNDPSLEIRAAAFAPFAEAAKNKKKIALQDTFGYDPSLDESGRRASLQAWQTWWGGVAGSSK